MKIIVAVQDSREGMTAVGFAHVDIPRPEAASGVKKVTVES